MLEIKLQSPALHLNQYWAYVSINILKSFLFNVLLKKAVETPALVRKKKKICSGFSDTSSWKVMATCSYAYNLNTTSEISDIHQNWLGLNFEN